MKVKIKKYPNYFGPYQLVEAIFFWAKTKDQGGVSEYPDWVFNLGEKLAHSRLGAVCSRLGESWVDFHNSRRVKIRLDDWDTWSMDYTLAPIILPMLRQLKSTQQGAPSVDFEDVPKNLRGETEENLFKRWDWVLDEMIWAFEQKCRDEWESDYTTGEHDIRFEEIEEGKYAGYAEMVEGPNHTAVIDWEGRKAHQARMSNGFRLFGKYFENLWT